MNDPMKQSALERSCIEILLDYANEQANTHQGKAIRAAIRSLADLLAEYREQLATKGGQALADEKPEEPCA